VVSTTTGVVAAGASVVGPTLVVDAVAAGPLAVVAAGEDPAQAASHDASPDTPVTSRKRRRE
jgi:hypothetical protein